MERGPPISTFRKIRIVRQLISNHLQETRNQLNRQLRPPLTHAHKCDPRRPVLKQELDSLMYNWLSLRESKTFLLPRLRSHPWVFRLRLAVTRRRNHVDAVRRCYPPDIDQVPDHHRQAWIAVRNKVGSKFLPQDCRPRSVCHRRSGNPAGGPRAGHHNHGLRHNYQRYGYYGHFRGAWHQSCRIRCEGCLHL